MYTRGCKYMPGGIQDVPLAFCVVPPTEVASEILEDAVTYKSRHDRSKIVRARVHDGHRPAGTQHHAVRLGFITPGITRMH